jgi:hypothetical protein
MSHLGRPPGSQAGGGKSLAGALLRHPEQCAGNLRAQARARRVLRRLWLLGGCILHRRRLLLQGWPGVGWWLWHAGEPVAVALALQSPVRELQRCLLHAHFMCLQCDRRLAHAMPATKITMFVI